MKKRAFTLIELLIVIAIIATLISLLLPALSAARIAGRRAAALAGLRDLGVGLSAYAQVNNDDFPTLRQHEEKGFLGLSLLGKVHQVSEKSFINPNTLDSGAPRRSSDDRYVLAELNGAEVTDATPITPADIAQVRFHCSYAYDNDIKRHRTGRSLVVAADRADYARGRTYSDNWQGKGICALWSDTHAEFTRRRSIADQADPNMYHHNEFGGEGAGEVNDGIRVTASTLDTHIRFFSEDEDDVLLPNP